jgi:predicted secreted hydrolase
MSAKEPFLNPIRRRWLMALAAGVSTPAIGGEWDPVRRGRVLTFPRDHGAHPESRIEWWYATGWLGSNPQDERGLVGFQLTFFRARTGLGEGMASRFAPRHLLFAHAAVSEIGAQRHRHAERLARWAGPADPSTRQRASLHDADIAVGGWRLKRETPSVSPDGAIWRTRIEGEGFGFSLDLTRTQPVLLQGEAGFSRKGPDEAQASHYLSEPQLAVRGEMVRDGRPQAVQGCAWLDHEWSDELLHPQAVGWDWIGMNLFDGSALTAFRLRRADGRALWAGGSWRGPTPSPTTAPQAYAPGEVQFEPGRRWRSPRTGADYPVEWTVNTPAGRHTVRALMDAQEMAGGATGTVYWEGLSELLDTQGRRVGLGYLEMTGYAGPLRLLGD